MDGSNAYTDAVLDEMGNRIPADTQIKIHRDRLGNAGELPPPLRSEDLRGPYRSVLRNSLAQAFHFAELTWKGNCSTLRALEGDKISLMWEFHLERIQADREHSLSPQIHPLEGV